MRSVVELLMKIDENSHKYDLYTFDESNYESKEEYLSWRNYILQKRAMSEDLLTDLVTSAATSAFNAVRHVFQKTSKEQIEQLAERALKDMVKNNPNMTWTD